MKSKFLYSIDQNTEVNQKQSELPIPSKKEFAIFKNNFENLKQSKTIDHDDPPKNSNCTSSLRSISPGNGQVSKTITSTRVGSAANNTISASRSKNKSNSNERAKSRKKNAAKDKIYQRPKTSKSQRKDNKQVQIKV